MRLPIHAFPVAPHIEMTDTASLATDREGYITASVEHAGKTYRFTFYQGFVRRLALRPRGGEEIEVYLQQGTYHVPQPQQGKKGPDPVSTIAIAGGPDDLDIELRVDDSPQDDQYRGPIESIQLTTQPGGTPGDQDPSVRPIRGADQIRSLVVRKRSGTAYERAYDGGDSSGDTVTVDNDTITCPPFC